MKNNYFTNKELTESITAKRLGIKNEPTKLLMTL